MKAPFRHFLGATLMAATVFAHAASAAQSPLTAQAVAAPDVASFGASVSAMERALAPLCDRMETRQLEVDKLPVAQRSHTQIDCDGFSHAGGQRLAEFVFADDALVFVWVLTDAAEEGALLAALKQQYGAPTHDLPGVVAFTDHRLALRRDKAELLYYGAAVAEVYRGWFDSMAGG
ncbi:MAG: hypothetical protein KDI71_13205 [Xanthomonadales bacterium]|nr:hypothetical protein [Xanthomonadales bacterium]